MFNSLSYKKKEPYYTQQHFMSTTMLDNSLNPSTDQSTKVNSYQILYYNNNNNSQFQLSSQQSSLLQQQQTQKPSLQSPQKYSHHPQIHHHPTKGDLYDMKDLFKYFVNSVTFVSFLSEFRYHLVTNIVSPNVYDIVKQRILFFYSNNIKKPPTESFCQKMVRIIFTDIPPPFYYTYRPTTINEKNFDEIIYHLRLSFGYADRHSVTSSYRRVHASKTRSNHNSIAPESCDNSSIPIPLQSELSLSYANSTESEIHKTKSKSKYHSVKIIPNKP